MLQARLCCCNTLAGGPSISISGGIICILGWARSGEPSLPSLNTLGGGLIFVKPCSSTLGDGRVGWSFGIFLVDGCKGCTGCGDDCGKWIVGLNLVATGDSGAGGGMGRALLRMTATFLMTWRVSSVTVRHGATGMGVLRIARISSQFYVKVVRSRFAAREWLLEDTGPYLRFSHWLFFGHNRQRNGNVLVLVRYTTRLFPLVPTSQDDLVFH